MRIRIAADLGGRLDHRPWPPAGTEIDVADDVGQGLIEGGHAVNASVRPEAPPRLPAPVVISEPAQTAAGPVISQEIAAAPEPEPEPRWQDEFGGSDPPEPEPEPAEPPAPGDPKAAWIDYAVSQGADRDVATAMTKADLMSRYGGRL